MESELDQKKFKTVTITIRKWNRPFFNQIGDIGTIAPLLLGIDV